MLTFNRNPNYKQTQIMNEPQNLKERQISKEIQIKNESKNLKEPQISKETETMNEAQI